ncbi:peptidoglycan editing factor PgeF [Endozoicomonas sp. Mp262]|uniref:peptidoglycan editing factor PgeF n=1 Tax=Endozoicomonas sp. Mp262 TaxID=2919499 RepID=UPI0021D7F5BB
MSQLAERYISVDWPAPPSIRAFATTRKGGKSSGSYSSFNLGGRSGDDLKNIQDNRQFLTDDWGWPANPCWLKQVHGSNVVHAMDCDPEPEADASFATEAGVPCLVLTADCLPVLFCHQSGHCVAAAHAGWKGLISGVLERTVAAMKCQPSEIMAWLGPAISQSHFEVGPEVRDAFLQGEPGASSAFMAGVGDRWMADLYLLARQRLERAGVHQIYGGDYCTYQQSDLFFSYRRDGKASGRMASAIWIEQAR